jgi:hypothetical protein
MENDFAGTYPIIIDGQTEGELTVSREGLFWVFEAKCNMRDDIVRLSVYGDGAEAYLGIMEPRNDILFLERKLSRSALGAFPQNITHAARKGMPEVIPASIMPEPAAVIGSKSVSPPAYEYDDFNSGIVPPDSDKPPPFSNLVPPCNCGGIVWQPCAVPCSLFSGIAEKKVCGYIKGALLARDEDILFLAVPESIIPELPKNSAIRFSNKIKISDDNYLICRIKNGKSISEP